jgi:hypothetical protein
MDPDPAIFVNDLHDDNKKINFFSSSKFTAYYFLKVHLHNFSKIKVIKKSQNSRNRGFSYYFCLIIEWSGSAYISQSVPFWPLDPGSGKGKNKDPDPDLGWTTRIIFRELRNHFFGIKYLNSLMQIRDPGRKKFGSGMFIQDSQHWSH